MIRASIRTRTRTRTRTGCAAAAFAAALAALAALGPAPALASTDGGTCDGGGGGSDAGGSSDAGSGTSDFSFDSGPSSRSCVDETDIVGYRRCARVGQWANRYNIPPIIVEVGAGVRTFTNTLTSVEGTLLHDHERFAYRAVSEPTPRGAPPRDAALVSTVRLGIGLRHGFYVAGEGELGALIRNTTRAEVMGSGMLGTPTISIGSVGVVAALGVVGVRGAFGRLSVGAEVVGGARALLYQYQSSYLACETTTSDMTGAAVLEARARASYWLSPFVSLGASAGTSMIDRGAWVGGVHLGLVTHAFSGLRD